MRLQPFTQADHEAVAAYNRRWKRSLRIVVIAQLIVLIAFCIYAGHIEYWQLVIPLLLVTDLIALFFISRKFRVSKKDLEEQIKITGNFRIVKKTADENTYYLRVDAEGTKVITVNAKTYAAVEQGEEPYFEFAKNSGFLLLLKRGNEVLHQ